MNFNIEDIFGDNEDIENIIDVETLFANIIKCVLVGNKIEKIIKKSKMEIVSKLNKNKSNSEKTNTDDTKESEEKIGTNENENDLSTDITLVESNKEPKNEDTVEDKTQEEDTVEDKTQEEVYDEDEDKIINKYYKIIALKCHPDKCKNELFHKYFLVAQEAYKKKDLVMILFIYSKTVADYKSITKNEIKILSSIVENLERDQQNQCSSVLYQWERLTEEEKCMYVEDVKRKNNL
jgi:hypothetical protein